MENQWKIVFLKMNTCRYGYLCYLSKHRGINFQIMATGNTGKHGGFEVLCFGGTLLWGKPNVQTRRPHSQKRRCLKWHNKTANMKVISNENDKTQFSCHVGWAVWDLRMNEHPDFSHVQHGFRSHKKRELGCSGFCWGLSDYPHGGPYLVSDLMQLSPQPCS